MCGCSRRNVSPVGKAKLAGAARIAPPPPSTKPFNMVQQNKPMVSLPPPDQNDVYKRRINTLRKEALGRSLGKRLT